MSPSPPDDLTGRLLEWADRQPAAPVCLASGRAPMTLAALGERVSVLRERLRDWGIERGDVVAWPVVDRPAAVAALAILPAGCTIAPLPAGASVESHAQTLARLRPKAIVADERAAAALAAARRLDLTELSAIDDGSGIAGAFDLALGRRTASLARPDRLAPRWAVIGATSGSTGRPKLVPHGHRQILASADAMADRLAFGPGDISGHVSPLHLAGGIRNALLHVLANGGAANVLPEMDADALLAQIAIGRVTYVSASFTLFREILERPVGSTADASRLRFVRIASGRLEPDELRRLEARLRAPVITGLSSSEGGSVSHQRLPPAPRSAGSVGPPLGCEVRLVDERGLDVEPGQAGEIVVRGPQVFDGYVDDDELNARAFVDGGFRMGDLGRFDEAGELHVIGRVKDVVNRGGDKISPAEIDAVLRASPELADVAAFGIPHPRLGEEIVAVAVLRPGCSADESTLRARVRERLGPRCAPRRVWFVDSIPRNAAGKVVRAALAALPGVDAATISDPPGGGAAPPRPPIEAAVSGLWTIAYGRPPDGPQARVDRAGDADAGSRLGGLITAAFGVLLAPDAFVGERSTLEGLAARIAGELARATVAGSDPLKPSSPSRDL